MLYFDFWLNEITFELIDLSWFKPTALETLVEILLTESGHWMSYEKLLIDLFSELEWDIRYKKKWYVNTFFRFYFEKISQPDFVIESLVCIIDMMKYDLIIHYF